MNKWYLMFAILCVSTLGYAQDTRNVEDNRQATQYKPVKKKKGLFSIFKKKNRQKSQAEEIADFRTRMKRVAKEKAKEDRLSKKKRYREHGYFGHKRKPKKRPPGKMKFCKVCGMTH